MKFKAFFISFFRPIFRLIISALWQLVWLAPVALLYWYAQRTLPSFIQAHFGLETIQNKMNTLDNVAEVMKSSTSLTNPTALLHYVSTQLSKLALSFQLNATQMTASVLQSLCSWGLDILWIIAVIYALIRTIRTYRSKSEVYQTALSVVQQLEPQLSSLKEELEALRVEVQQFKQQSTQQLPPSEDTHENLLPKE